MLEPVHRRWLDVVFVLYLAVVAYGVFGPSPGERLSQAGHGARQIDVEVRSAVPGRGGGTESGHPQTRDLVPDLDTADVGNIVMFVPFGLLFPTRWPRWRWWTIPAGVALSLAIELTQGTFLSWRTPSFTDVRWNSLGAIVGFVLWLVASAIRRRSPVSAA